MKVFIRGKASQLVFNRGEVGSPDSEDRKLKRVLVPISGREEDFYRPVSRKFKHLSLVAYVSAASDPRTPLIVSISPIPDSL
jgi:hypothetical protein